MVIKNTAIESIEEPIRSGDTNLQKYLLEREGAVSNSFSPSMFNLRPSFTTAGNYEVVIKLPKPIFNYHRARPGTVDESQDELLNLFPELSTISEEDIEKVTRKRELT